MSLDPPLRDSKGRTDRTSSPDGGDRRASASFWLPVGTIIGAAVFGKYAQDIAQWVVCGHSVLKGRDSCGDMARAEALSIGTLISTMVAVATAAAAVNRIKVTARAAAITIVGALVAALFLLLKAATEGDENKLPRLDLLWVPLYFYAVCVLLFAIPLLFAPRAPRDLGPALSLQLRLAAAVLIGAAFGYAAQFGAELYWQGFDFRGYGVQKFIVAPSATAIAVGAWAVALFDPYLRPAIWAAAPGRRRPWVAFYAVGAIFLAGGYGALFHGQAVGTLARAYGALLVAGLALPALGAIAIALALRRTNLLRQRLAAVATLTGGAIAAATSTGFALLNLRSGMPSGADIPPFIAAQVLASVAAVLTVFATHRVIAVWTDLNSGVEQ